MFDLTPDPVAFRIGPLPIHWYGIAYAAGLTAVYLLLTWLARRAGRNPELVGNGLLVIALAALIGGRLYHVIDEWSVYSRDPITILGLQRTADGGLTFAGLAGLGVYGGIITGTIAAWVYIRRIGEPFWTWADIVAPALFLMQAIGRLGNFFNQELYGPPTTLPWGIPIDCDHRIAEWPCATFPDTTRFHPLFGYESLSGLLGMVFLVYLFVRHRDRLAPGSLLFLFFIWYGLTRFALENLRANNWIVFGVPTAQIVSMVFILIGVIGLAWRNRGPAGRRRAYDDLDTNEDAADPDDPSVERVSEPTTGSV